jgi:peroxiredoxin
VKTNVTTIALAVVLAAPAAAQTQKPSFVSVSQLQDAHDRALIRDLKTYVEEHPKADDLDQAYLALFNKAIEHDWFVEHEAIAARYLNDHPDGPIQSLARIVSTMARAQQGQYADALARYKELMAGLGKPEQEEFASNFADTLGRATTTAGEYHLARQVYEGLLERYGDSPNVRQKVREELNRLDKVGKPAPNIVVKDLDGKNFRLDDLRGKFVLVDFWATWCAPCVAELPRVQAAYARYHAAGFEVVAVSLDETSTALSDFVKSRNIPWRQIHNAGAGGDLVEAFGVTSIPATFLIDPQGTVVRLELRGPALEKALAQLLRSAQAGHPGAPLAR